MTEHRRTGRLKRRPLRAVALAGLSVAVLGACAVPPSGRSATVAEILNYARAQPGERVAMESACEEAVARQAGDLPYKALFAGLFNVSREASGVTFCTALIEAVVAGELTEEQQDVFSRPRQVRGLAPVGALVRTVLVAHERLAAQQAQRPPQALSCGCGQ